MTAASGHFKSNNHALATGILLAWLTKKGFDVTAEVADDEDYTPRMSIYIQHLDATIAIEVLPPEEDLL